MCFEKSVLFFILSVVTLFKISAEEFQGVIRSSKDNKSVSYANIGVIRQNLGTVSDHEGNYKIKIGEEFDKDSLRISCIGFKPITILVADFKKTENKDFVLEENVVDLKELTVLPKKYKQKTFGIKLKKSPVAVGFQENVLGAECGLRFRTKNKAYLENLTLSINTCAYDSVFYRINVYQLNENKVFENILNTPVYMKFSKEQIKESIFFDLAKYNIVVEGDFIVSLEHVKDLGSGKLWFPAALNKKTYSKKTSQSEWKTSPVGFALSVEALVEK